MPPGSTLVHTINPEDETRHRFVGELELKGQVQAAWYKWVLDDGMEIQLQLQFIPDEAEYSKLPVVQHPQEPVTSPRLIDINVDDSNEKELLTLFFGEKLAGEIVQKKLNRSVNGVITFKEYQTLVECDKRFFNADVATFKPSGKVKVLGKLPDLGC